MTYQDYTNFSEYASHEVSRFTELGFMSFLGDHTLGVAITIMVLFVLYKIFASGGDDKKPVEEYKEPSPVVTNI